MDEDGEGEPGHDGVGQDLFDAEAEFDCDLEIAEDEQSASKWKGKALPELSAGEDANAPGALVNKVLIFFFNFFFILSLY